MPPSAVAQRSEDIDDESTRKAALASERISNGHHASLPSSPNGVQGEPSLDIGPNVATATRNGADGPGPGPDPDPDLNSGPDSDPDSDLVFDVPPGIHSRPDPAPSLTMRSSPQPASASLEAIFHNTSTFAWLMGLLASVLIGVRWLSTENWGTRPGLLQYGITFGMFCAGIVFGLAHALYEARKSRISYISWIKIGNSAAALATFTAVYLLWFPSGYEFVLFPWQAGSLPETPFACRSRVLEQQAVLFSDDYYHVPFERPFSNLTRFDEIRSNHTLCSQGFEGNQDLYGQGIRVSIYLQWFTALLSNNLLPDTRQQTRTVYLVFSFCLFVATFYLSFAESCVFGIEIEVMYWLYWPGFLCVFVSAPSQTRLGSQSRWVVLNWDIVVHYVTHILMAYHGLWFMWWAYDQKFARMPCGTYQFLSYKALDPSFSYNMVRGLGMIIVGPVVVIFLMSFHAIAFGLTSEMLMAIQDSALYQEIFSKPDRQLVRSLADDQSPESPSQWSPQDHWVIRWSTNLYERVRWIYGRLRVAMGLPEHTQSGIRLITTLDIERRVYYRLKCLLLWIASFTIAVTAIETTLSWNKIGGVNNIPGPGQFIPLTISMGGLVQVLYRLFSREMARRRDIKRRRLLQTGEDFEMETLPPTLSGALKFALSEADSSFLTNDGILPYMESTRRPRVSDEDSYAMNGALGTQISTPSEDPQNTTSGTFGAQQPAAVPAAVPVSEGLPRVAHEPLTAQSTTRREEVATPEDSV